MYTAEDRQFSDVAPPEAGKVTVLTLDTSVRVYDLTALPFGDAPAGGAFSMFLQWYTTAQLYFVFSSVSNATIDETAALAAGGAATFTANGCWEQPANTQLERRLIFPRHRYFVVKGGAAGKVRLSAASFAASP